MKELCGARNFVVERAVQSMLNLGVEAATKHHDLRLWLDSLDLRQYLSILLDMGVKTVDDLRLVDRSDLEGRMKLIEERKFMLAASRLKTPRSTISTSTTTTGSEECSKECSMPLFSFSPSSFTSPGPPLAPQSPKATLRAPTFPADTIRGAASAKVASPVALEEEDMELYPDGSFAVIVAINDYTSSVPLDECGLSNLQCARNDGELIKDTLVNRHGFVMLGELYDASATSMDLLDLLDTVKNAMEGKLRARFVFFLASHGHLDDDGRGWICTHGCRLNKLNSTCIKMSVLKDFAESIDCQHQLYLLDCCHAGSLLVTTRGGQAKKAATTTTRSEYELAMLSSPAIHGLTAVTKTEQALEERGHGMFTRSFVEGLDGGVGVFARGVRKHVTTTELFSYVQRRVLELAKQKGRDQTPRCEPLLVNHKKKPCDGQMLFFDSRERRPSGSKRERREEQAASKATRGGDENHSALRGERPSGGIGGGAAHRNSSSASPSTNESSSGSKREGKEEQAASKATRGGHENHSALNKFNKTTTFGTTNQPERESEEDRASFSKIQMKFGHRRSRTYG
jgi:hypothetical protein